MEPPAAPAPAFDLMAMIGKDYPSFHAAADALEASMLAFPQPDLPPVHTITAGLYSRRLFMPAGMMIVSKIHRKQHQYVIFSGRATVFTEAGAVEVGAGFSGITEPGTRRILFIHEDCDWMTFHPTDKTDPASIEAEIILPRHLLEETFPQLTS